MKFSQIDRKQWEELQPFMDTCLLPLTGLSGRESPWQTTDALERLGEAMEDLEKRYVGRMVTYPALHYMDLDETATVEQIGRVCTQLRKGGFRYIVLVTAERALETLRVPEADLMLAWNDIRSGRAVELVAGVWGSSAFINNDS